MMGIFCQNVTSLFIFTFLKPHSDAFMTLFQIHFLKLMYRYTCIYANLNELITKLLRLFDIIKFKHFGFWRQVLILYTIEVGLNMSNTKLHTPIGPGPILLSPALTLG